MVYIGAYDARIENRPLGVVYRYDGRELEVFYQPPYERCYVEDIKYVFDVLWVAGTKTENGDHQAYFAKYDGYEWNEIDVPDHVAESSFYNVAPISSDACWVRTWRAVYKYDGGAWQKKLGFDTKSYKMGLAVSDRGVVFVPSDPRYYTTGWTVNVSDDDGATWHAEKVDFGDDRFRVYYYNYYPVTSVGETLYLTAQLKATTPLPYEESKAYLGIIKREAAPAGCGRYELAFLSSPTTSPARDFRGLAFHDAGNGRAVGYYTSVALEHGEWVTEEVDSFAMYRPVFTGITASYPFYWSILEDDAFSSRDSIFWLCRTR
jgi:hypothetical protein